MKAQATARAHSNIALIKYWGKQDPVQVIPYTSSLSLTLREFYTDTSVEFFPGRPVSEDEVLLDGKPLQGVPRARVLRFLDLMRSQTMDAQLRTAGARVETHNTVPTAAGLASSASGFAALALAGAAALGVSTEPVGLSRLARRGSGSASRSLFGGLAMWHRGHDDESCHGESLDPTGAQLGFVVALVSESAKEISSGKAMAHTVATSPLYDAWVCQSHSDFSAARAAITDGDFAALGELVEANALGMHATMFAARPAVNYWLPDTLRVLHAVRALRGEGLEAYCTMDAGPNVKVLARQGDLQAVQDELAARIPGITTLTTGPGPGAYLKAEPK